MKILDDFPQPAEPYIEPGGPQRPAITCPHCGNSIVLVLPIDLKMFSKIATAFAALHSYCAQKQIFEKPL